MAFWSDEQWRSLKKGKEPIQPFRTDRIEAANYLLSVGNEIFVSEPEKSSTAKKLELDQDFIIEPGQFAFLLTAETVKIPLDVLGFISIRATKKFLGLVNISGFHVDPGYSGKLIFSVFNAGPAKIHIKSGDPIFPIWFADLQTPTSKRALVGYDSIPSKLLTPISGDFTTAYQVAKQVAGLTKRLSEAEEKLSDLRSKYIYYGVIITVILLLFGPALSNRFFKFVSKFESPTLETSSSIEPKSQPSPTPSPPVVTPQN
jgi:dCTP deaminase